MDLQEKMNRLAKKDGFDYMEQVGEFKGCGVWCFRSKEIMYTGYPLFVLTKGSKAKIIARGINPKFHRAVWDYVNSLPHDDDDDIDID